MSIERKLLAAVRKADCDFGLIERKDRVLVGVSGGKDSLALLALLAVYSRFSAKDFTFTACFLDLGFPAADRRPLADFCRSLGVELIEEDCTDVYPILLQHRTSTGLLPCSICSRMKKAAINAVAKRLNCNKVAFAHHADDAIETLLMNMTHGGRVATFAPKMTLERAGVTFIRPLAYVREKDIGAYVREKNLPVMKNSCGNDGYSERAEMKEVLNSYYARHRDAYDNFLTMLTNADKLDLWTDDLGNADGAGLFIKKVRTSADFIASLEIRRHVFVEEQGIAFSDEIDGSDSPDHVYYLAYLHGRPVASARLIIESESLVRLGRLAVLKDARRQGVGRALVHYIEKTFSQKHAPVTFRLDAQLTAAGFYEKCGYRRVGPDFIEVEISHCPMEKTISKPLMDRELRG